MRGKASVGVVRIAAMRLLAIGVVTFNNPPLQIQHLLRSIETAARRFPGWEVQVLGVDNGDATVWPSTELGIRRLESAGNVGFAPATNRLMAQAFAEKSVDAFLCLNPDAVLHPRALAEMAAVAERPPLAIVEARQFPEEHPKPYDPVTLETPWATGACLWIPREAYERIGGFDDRFFLFCEDVDLSWRARQAGLSVRVAPDAWVGHEVLSRGPSPHREKLALLAARYLAHKWKGPDLLRWTEERLVVDGHFSSASKLPLLPPVTFEPTPGIADFVHRFWFAEARW